MENVPNLLDIIEKFGFVGIMSFGSTYIVIKIYERKYFTELSSIVKMIIQFTFAFLYLFVPIVFQNIILEKIKDAAGVVIGMSAIWQFLKARTK